MNPYTHLTAFFLSWNILFSHSRKCLRHFSVVHEWQGSQNLRRAEFGWDLWKSSGPTPLPKQGHLQLVAKDCVLVTTEYLQGQRFHNLSGKSLTVLSCPQSENVFLDVWGEPPVFLFVPIISSPVTGTDDKSLTSSSLHPPFRCLYTLVGFPQSYLFSILNGPSSLSLHA